MSKLYLIAHKCRGVPAFDVACQMPCPECSAEGCVECDSLGYWWIIPTSGHRAYPWHWFALTELEGDVGQGFFDAINAEMPLDLLDHYPHSTHTEPKRDLITILGLNLRPAAPTTPFPRRL